MEGAAIFTHASLRLSAHIWPWALNIEFHAVTHVAKPFIPSFTCMEIVYKLGHASSVPSHWNTFHTDWITLFPLSLSLSLSHYSDTHSVLSAGSQSCLRYQYWKAGGRRGTERGTFIYFGFEKHFLRTSACSCHIPVFDLRLCCVPVWHDDVVGSCCAVKDCTIFFYALIQSVIPVTALSTYHWILSSVIKYISSWISTFFPLYSASVCGPLLPQSPLTVAESYRGLDTQWGAASSPSGQLQRCQSESQEAPASLIHPLLAHQGQGPLGGGVSERGGAGEDGVQGGFPGEGLVFPRSSWVWHWSGLPQQCGHRQQRSGGSRLCLTGGGLPLHLFTCFTFTPGDPDVAHQSRPYAVVPAGGEGERGVGWAHIDWSEEENFLLSFCFVFLLFPRDRAAIWVEEGQDHLQTSLPQTISSQWAWRAGAHAASKTCKTGPFFLLLQKSLLFQSKSQVPPCVFWTAVTETCPLLRVTNVAVYYILLSGNFIK